MFPRNYGVSPQFLQPFSIDSADFPCRGPAFSSPRSFYGQNICSVVLVLVPKPKKWFQSLTNVVSITLPIKRSAINFIINQTSLLRKYLAGLQHWCPSFVNGSKIYFWPFFGNFIFANFCRKKLIFSINPLWNKLAQTPSPTTTLCDRDRCDQGYIYLVHSYPTNRQPSLYFSNTSYFHFFFLIG